MNARIRVALALGSLLTAILFSSTIAGPTFARSTGPRHSREEKCQIADDVMQFFFGMSLDRPGCLKQMNDD